MKKITRATRTASDLTAGRPPPAADAPSPPAAAPRGRGRPATGQMPQRLFRCEDDLWREVQAAAAEEGVTAAEWVRRALQLRLGTGHSTGSSG